MEDTLDSLLTGSDDEAEEDAVVSKVLDEIGIEVNSKVWKVLEQVREGRKGVMKGMDTLAIVARGKIYTQHRLVYGRLHTPCTSYTMQLHVHTDHTTQCIHSCHSISTDANVMHTTCVCVCVCETCTHVP